MSISVGIVDDQKLFRRGMASLIQEFEGIEVVLEASNGKELLDKVRVNQPDVVLLDLEMPVMDGIEATQILTEQYPDIKIIIISMHDGESFISHSMKEGANGYLFKEAEPREVELAINCVIENNFYFNDQVSAALLKSMTNHNSPINPIFRSGFELTDRELDVLKLICEELTSAEIADKLFLSKRTVEGHRTSLLNKTGARNTVGLVIYALKAGIV
ncbi:response regulator transcription factor [Pontibacter sp. G13]|uniref:response regulator transcription factor n=1 Tax=Pontibacter sp. G13 TaxID=3074898 RepID=UPI00288BA58F|nr:response regulator transcription factor [Pontibacter sp. G13]WNJ16195.1 response regulator transcription factor [Pontibacter sp. G13]